jgi:hypothetical protein
MLFDYIMALMNWGTPRSTLPRFEILIAALKKAVRASYQVHQMNEKTFEKLVEDPEEKPESILIYYFNPSDFVVEEQAQMIK